MKRLKLQDLESRKYMKKYIKNLKTIVASEIQLDKEIIRSMKSNMSKFVLNNSYGKEYMAELNLGIEKNEQELEELIKLYEGIPRYKNLIEIFQGICLEGNTFNKQDPLKYVEEHISGFENMESDEQLRIKGQCTTKISMDQIKQHKEMKIPVDGYCIYSLIGHTGEYEICSFSHRREVEKEILSESGLPNRLIGEIIVLYNGEPKKYYVINKNGTILTKEQIEKMNKKTIGKLKVIWGKDKIKDATYKIYEFPTD